MTSGRRTIDGPNHFTIDGIAICGMGRVAFRPRTHAGGCRQCARIYIRRGTIR